jgi:hypothetical protein
MNLKKKKIYLSPPSSPAAHQLLPAAAHSPRPLFFSFVSLTTRPHRSVPPRPFPFFFPLGFARPGAAVNPAAPGRLPLPFLLTRAGQLRQLTLSCSIRSFPFP